MEGDCCPVKKLISVGRRQRSWRTLLTLGVTTVFLAAAACGGGNASGGGSNGVPGSVTIAYQPGIGYAPLLVMKNAKTLETQYPNTKFTWTQLSSGAAIQDGVLSGDIQIAAGGVAPLIIGAAKGVDWKYIAAMNDADLWLMAKDPQYQTVKNFKSGGKIAMPSPTSIQGVVLRKAAEKQLGDVHALDTNIVSFDHPDGLQALTSGQVAGHLTSPPFEFEEQQQGARVVARSYDLFGGPHTFNGVFATSKFYNANTAFSQKLFTDLQDAVQQINSNPDKAAQALSEESGGKVGAAQYKTWITDKAITYTVTPHSLMAFATFMKEAGLIKKTPDSWKDLVFPTAENLQGS